MTTAGSAQKTTTLHSFDEFATLTHPIMKKAHIKCLNFRRVNNRFEFPSLASLYAGIAMMMMQCIGCTIGIVLGLRAGHIAAAKYLASEFSIALTMVVRGMTLLFKAKKIASIFNELDSIFPKSEHLQQRMNLPTFALALNGRFRIAFRSITAAIVCFVGMPLFQFAMQYGKYELNEEVPLEFHELKSWLPFGIKQSFKLYPLMYIIETVQTLHGVAIFVEWDHVFTVIVSQLCMHYEYLNQCIIELNANEASDEAKSEKFYENLMQCIDYHQQLNGLGYALSDIFSASILVSDFVSSSAICLHLYLITNTEDIMMITEKLSILLSLLYLVYDMAKQGSQLQTLSEDIRDSIYAHNWYEGSTYYRKYVTMWMQHANEPYRLIAFNMFEVNMEHFHALLMLAYEMLTFLKTMQ